MEITANIDDLIKSLEEAQKVITRKLEGMVTLFAYNFVIQASKNTPIGDEESIKLGESGISPYSKYFQLYDTREAEWGIKAEPGYHKGAWSYSENSSFQFNPNINDPEYVAERSYSAASTAYKVGDTFYIGAIGPGFYMLEVDRKSSQAPNGIIQPTLDDIQVIYKTDMQRFFETS